MSCSGGGMPDSLAGGSIHLATGTYRVTAIRTLAEAHAKAEQVLVVAAVLGRPDLAAWGQLGIVAAGPQESVKRCEPLLALIGVEHSSPVTKPETATAIKLANNMVLGAVIVAQAEAFSLVRKYGVAPQVMFEVMN